MLSAMHAFLADAIVVLHLVYVGFVVLGYLAILLGAALRWSWIRRRGFRVPHAICTLIVAVEAVFGVVCPLTTWERDLRRAAGQRPEDVSFVGKLVRDVLFYDAPAWVFTTCYVVFGLIVIGTWILVPPHGRKKRGLAQA